jgi:hypothetical protein
MTIPDSPRVYLANPRGISALGRRAAFRSWAEKVVPADRPQFARYPPSHCANFEQNSGLQRRIQARGHDMRVAGHEFGAIR